MRALADGPLAMGQVLWTPPADARERFELGRYLEWLKDERGFDFPGYEELHRWFARIRPMSACSGRRTCRGRSGSRARG
jgi:hypothetical protein